MKRVGSIISNLYGETVNDSSSRAAQSEDKFVQLGDSEFNLSSLAKAVYRDFRLFVSSPKFSCIGAKAAINNDSHRFEFYKEMNVPETTSSLARALRGFARERENLETNYATFIASFAAPAICDEAHWEKLLWAQLQSLHELDFAAGSAWDASVSSDPENANFSFSFAETAFFVVGLHPKSSRLARRFAHPTLVFNPHAQFERLREGSGYGRMQQTIRARELKLQGSLNPNLSNFGEQSEARQYSGRATEKKWKCPFHALFGGRK